MIRFLCLSILLAVSIAGHSDTLAGRIVRVIDGDTVVVLDSSNVQRKIRLQGIDAPEVGQSYGKASKKYLSGLVAGKRVIVDYRKRDRYGRIVGKVLFDQQDMNFEQVVSGLA